MKNKIIKTIIIIILVTVIIILIAINFTVRRVISDSMSPVINTGDICVINKNSIEDAKCNDIICIKLDNKYVIHRVIEVNTINNKIVLRTKGDNNSQNDYKASYIDNYIGKVVWVIHL